MYSGERKNIRKEKRIQTKFVALFALHQCLAIVELTHCEAVVGHVHQQVTPVLLTVDLIVPPLLGAVMKHPTRSVRIRSIHANPDLTGAQFDGDVVLIGNVWRLEMFPQLAQHTRQMIGDVAVLSSPNHDRVDGRATKTENGIVRIVVPVNQGHIQIRLGTDSVAV
jgi:hypothetical protein